ncbi:MAG: cupin domain-containing protein [Planctomycetota bacterium]
MLRESVPPTVFANCHDGIGDVLAQVLIDEDEGPRGLAFLHDLRVPPGTSIGEHRHEHPEVYYLIAGSGELLWDGARQRIGPGHLSMVECGHSHGFVNDGSEDARIIVIGLR